MFHMPMSSPMMTTMLGFAACANAGVAPIEKTSSNIAPKPPSSDEMFRMNLILGTPLHCMSSHLFESIKRPFDCYAGRPQCALTSVSFSRHLGAKFHVAADIAERCLRLISGRLANHGKSIRCQVSSSKDAIDDCSDDAMCFALFRCSHRIAMCCSGVLQDAADILMIEDLKIVQCEHRTRSRRAARPDKPLSVSSKFDIGRIARVAEERSTWS